jgi:hypothetical protein
MYSASGLSCNTSNVICLNSSKVDDLISNTANRDSSLGLSLPRELHVANTEHLNSIRRVLETLVSVNIPSCNNDNRED